MSVVRERIFSRLYRDSVELMAIASTLERAEGVERVGAVMATPANLAILQASGMLPAGLIAAPDDLVIVVRAQDEDAATVTLEEAEQHLAGGDVPGSQPSGTVLHTIADAMTQKLPPTLATISVPGEFAPIVGEQALRAGLHVFCFSDNVPVEDEVRLKAIARDSNLLFMGPDCGTAIIDGVPLGFANAVRRAAVGIVAASGTGAQEVSVLLDRAGAGVSQLIGVGGRDLSGQVGGAMTLFALDLLQADPSTEVIVVVSKPPAREVADRLLHKLDAIAATGTPVVACLLGEAPQVRASGVVVCGTLTESGAIATADSVGLRLAPGDAPADTLAGWRAGPGRIHGLYTGGTLASEARLILRDAGAPCTIIDLGDDQYTAGRPHPMIDPTLRSDHIAAAGADPDITVLLLDLVLGYGAHLDPAAELAQAVIAARQRASEDGRALLAIASVCGSPQDQQGLPAQRETLLDAGIALAPSNAGAARLAARAVGVSS